MADYIIEYKALDKTERVIKMGKMKVKNKANKFVAQCSFEEYLKRKYPNFNRLIVVEIKEDFMSMFGSIFGDAFNN